jgi:hypothetical protein
MRSRAWAYYTVNKLPKLKNIALSTPGPPSPPTIQFSTSVIAKCAKIESATLSTMSSSPPDNDLKNFTEFIIARGGGGDVIPPDSDLKVISFRSRGVSPPDVDLSAVKLPARAVHEHNKKFGLYMLL